MKLSTACRELFWQYIEGKISFRELKQKIEALQSMQGDIFLKTEGIK